MCVCVCWRTRAQRCQSLPLKRNSVYAACVLISIFFICEVTALLGQLHQPPHLFRLQGPRCIDLKEESQFRREGFGGEEEKKKKTYPSSESVIERPGRRNGCSSNNGVGEEISHLFFTVFQIGEWTQKMRDSPPPLSPAGRALHPRKISRLKKKCILSDFFVEKLD